MQPSRKSPAEAEVLVVGAGLTGLSLAATLSAAGRDVWLAEGRDRIGGRVLSRAVGGDRFDLGPAWFWPGQPRIAAMVDALGLAAFPQFADGRLVFQDASGAIRRDIDMAPMAGALRIAGGAASLTDALATRIPQGRIVAGWRLLSIRCEGDALIAGFETPAGPADARTSQVALCLPPRLVASLDFTPTPAGLPTLAKTPTWMAGHAKFLAVYDRPFWRAEGLSGDAISHRGPLAEVHDASPDGGDAGALFGFVGAPAGDRPEATLTADATAQLGALFGEPAASPAHVFYEDWAEEPMTSVAADREGLSAHPNYGPLPAFEPPYSGRLVFASSETGRGFGGFLEGALEAAEDAAAALGARPVSL